MRRRLRSVRSLLASIRVQLTLWYLAILATILVVFSAILYLSLSRSLHDGVDRALVTQAQQVIATLDIENGRIRLSDSPDALPAGSVVSLVSVTGAPLVVSDPGGVLARSAAAAAAAAHGETLFTVVGLPDGDEWRVFTQPVMDGGATVAVIQVARSERDVESALGQLIGLMAFAIPGTLLLAGAGGLFLASRAIGPIDRITRLAARLSGDDLSGRIGLPARSDEIGRLAATFDGMLDRLEAAFLRQRQFTADASHELRTPLAIVISQIDVTLARGRPVAAYRKVLSSIREDAARLSQLLDVLLTLARADAGRETMVRQPVNLTEVVDDTLTALLPLAEEQGVRVERSLDDDVMVTGDEVRLAQLVVNLVTNGIKYTPAGGSVVVALRRDERQSILTVRDSGVGIAAEHLPHLFERFYRVDPARAGGDGGARLGLAIAEWVAQAHHGQMTVDSIPGQGSVFTVRLPLADAH